MDLGLGAGRGYGSISHGLGSGTIGLGAVGLGLARGIGSPAATTSILALAKELLDDLVVYLFWENVLGGAPVGKSGQAARQPLVLGLRFITRTRQRPRRVARPNAKEVWEVVQVPALRLIDDDLWDAVRRRQQSLSFAIPRDDDGNALNRAHRRKFLFSGLLKCGCCGGGFTIVGRVAVEFEQRIKSDALELQSLERKIASIVAAIEEGKYSRALGDRLADLERQRDLISARKVENPQGTIRLHPRLADVYAEKIQQLEEALNEPSIREEAAEVFRSLVDRVELRPRDKGQGLEALLYGDLVEILGFCDKDEKRKLPERMPSGS